MHISISPGLIFAQKALFGGLIFGRTYFLKGLSFEGILCFKMGTGLDNKRQPKTLRKPLETANPNRDHGLIFRTAYYWRS